MRNSGWGGVALIAILYIHFLIFAQFAFLARMAALGIAGTDLKIIMATMAGAGIFFSLFGPRVVFIPNPVMRLRLGLAVSAAAALLSLAPLMTATAGVVALLIGAGLGISTVTLVTHLDEWVGRRRGILKVGLGTGLAYAVCNVPAVFTASAQAQAFLGAGLCVAGIAVPLNVVAESHRRKDVATERIPFLVALLGFAALVWLDSAAFFIIQHTRTLKAGTWLGGVHLWMNAGLHFGAALFAGALLQRRKTSATLALAFGALGFACILLRNPELILSASLLYPVGVSLYSVALVAYPSFLSPADSRGQRGLQAGILYAVAGWIGSALGIGMGQNLGHVPTGFVALAGAMVLLPVIVSISRTRTREVALLSVAALAAFLIFRFVPFARGEGATTAAERGRQVYISEGCISCHSQYVRPNSPDVLMWGPVEGLDQIHAQRPPLIGNRRQGPDLAEVGVRRSPLWLKAHLMNPAEVSYRSPMPSYAFLFRDGRGDDLVNYLAGLRGAGAAQQLAREATWQPDASAWKFASTEDGKELYQQNCATCHDSSGAVRNRWKSSWTRMPQDTAVLQSFARTHPGTNLAQISKFGITGSDMPGHEYLNDRQLASLAEFLKSTPVEPQNKTD